MDDDDDEREDYIRSPGFSDTRRLTGLIRDGEINKVETVLADHPSILYKQVLIATVKHGQYQMPLVNWLGMRLTTDTDFAASFDAKRCARVFVTVWSKLRSAEAGAVLAKCYRDAAGWPDIVECVVCFEPIVALSARP